VDTAALYYNVDTKKLYISLKDSGFVFTSPFVDNLKIVDAYKNPSFIESYNHTNKIIVDTKLLKDILQFLGIFTRNIINEKINITIMSENEMMISSEEGEDTSGKKIKGFKVIAIKSDVELVGYEISVSRDKFLSEVSCIYDSNVNIFLKEGSKIMVLKADSNTNRFFILKGI